MHFESSHHRQGLATTRTASQNGSILLPGDNIYGFSGTLEPNASPSLISLLPSRFFSVLGLSRQCQHLIGGPSSNHLTVVIEERDAPILSLFRLREQGSGLID